MMHRSGFIALAIIAAALLFLSPAISMGEAYEGYTLFSPNNSTHSYLVNMSNSVVYTWNHTIAGGYSCYLTEDGSLWRPATSNNSNLNGGAAAGIVQRYGPNGQLAWSYTYSNNTVRTHHDIEPMPNGNVLLIAWERKSAAEAVQAGLDSSHEIWPDHIIEVQPVGTTGGTIVWQWHAWDHLIQDHDATKSNYGVVGDHPELLDINVGGSALGGDWMHTNAISYNPVWDQIVISSHNLDELYVIDHSTTTAQAASHSGGNSGKGGDILYRWGNPANYRRSGPRVFDVVHCSVWIPAGLPGAGNIMAFNNRESVGQSMVVELVPPADANGIYETLPAGAIYGPTSPTWSYTSTGFFSQHLGGCQRLPNGNTFIVEATVGYMFEVNSAGVTQWSYNRGGEIARALRYGRYYPGLAALGVVADVDQGDPTGEARLLLNEPNPFRDGTQIQYHVPQEGIVSLGVFDLTGRQVASLVNGPQSAGLQSVFFDAKDLPTGVYLCRLDAAGSTRVRKMIRLR